MVGARVRRQQVAYALGRGLSSRRACALLSVARSTLGYQSRLVVKDAPALTRMRELAGQISPLRLPADSHLPPTRRPRDEPRPGASPLAPGGAAGAAASAASTRRGEPTAAAAVDDAESRVGVRLRVRHLRQRPDAQVLDDHRRMDPRVPGDRRRRWD